MSELRYQLSTDVGEKTRGGILSLLKEFNWGRNEVFFASRERPENTPKPLELVAFDQHGNVAGGLIGASQFKWLKIDYLVVREEQRRKGIGRRLMGLAEGEAVMRGCTYIFLDTMSYQAPEFYKRIGYEQAGFMRDWDSHGHDKYLFVKKIS